MRITYGPVGLVVAVSLGPSAASAGEPVRLNDALPPWARLTFEQRTRVEHLHADFRTPAGPGSALMLRELVSLELSKGNWFVRGELQDARMFATSRVEHRDTLTNTLEPLQAHIGVSARDVLESGDRARVLVGRMTVDFGSRRLLVRNDFRNTINAFTGVDAEWTGARGDGWRFVGAVPVVRRPNEETDLERLKRGDPELDTEATNAVLFATMVAVGARPSTGNTRVEAYAIGLREHDTDSVQTSNRRLLTPGVRALRAPQRAQFDAHVELIGQLGRSRASRRPNDTRDLSHRAYSVAVTVGYTFDVPSHVRPALVFDHATGDASPNDRVNERFDPLFGGRRFDWGATSLWGVFSRQNISAIAGRLDARPHARIESLASYRLAWLASAHDGWTVARIVDRTGRSGTFIGQVIEARVRCFVLPQQVSVEAGAMALLRGEFAQRAPGGRKDTPAHLYVQVTSTF